MKLGYLLASERGGTDPVLARIAQDLGLRGLRLCGAVQVNTRRPGDRPCDMDLILLPDGPAFRISQDRGAWARGCRLDAHALALAAARVAATLDPGADLLIINKFGKHEAEGRGFRDVIAAAVTLDIPVLVGLGPLNREAFDLFAGGTAVELPADVATLSAWADRRATDRGGRIGATPAEPGPVRRQCPSRAT